MPQAEPFKAVAEGNGFPFPISLVVDVSSYHNWVTLGGVSSGTATKEQINTSLLRAVCLYWNLYSIKDTTAKSNLFFSSKGVTEFDIDKDVELSDSNILQLRPDPKKRINGLGIFSKREQLPEDQLHIVNGNVGSSVFVKVQPIKMYNGDPSNEDNFVGYGLKDFISILGGSNFYDDVHVIRANILIASYDPNNLADFEGSQSSAYGGYITNIKRKAFDVNLKVTLSKENGGETLIPFKSFTNANSYSTQFLLSPTLSISSNSASASSSESGGQIYPNGTDTRFTYAGDIDLSFDANTILELYTYPPK